MLRILQGDALDHLRTLPAQSVQCCVTSPPYWGLRDYGTAQWEGGDAGCDHKIDQSKRHADAYKFVNGQGEGGKSLTSWTTRNGTDNAFRDCPKCGARRIDSQLGLESTPEEYIANLVAVFREVGRVLRDDGSLWLNLGDSYANDTKWGGSTGGLHPEELHGANGLGQRCKRQTGLKPKDLCMMPARVAIALQADGWWIRSTIIWHKPNPMPESVTDRPTTSHEYIFLLTKNGGNPLIWRARDTGEWSYKPDLSEMIDKRGAITKQYAQPNSPESIKSPYGQGFMRRAAEYDLDEEDAIENESWKGSRFDKGKTAEHQLNRSQSAESRAEQEEIPRWKGFDYLYDAEAIREPHSRDWSNGRCGGTLGPNGSKKIQLTENDPNFRNGHSQWERESYPEMNPDGRNKRTVWTIATQPYAEAHFATFPEEIPKLCILAGSKPGDTILDPFAGSGTVGKVALELGRRAALIELNPKYVQMIEDRTRVTPGMF